MRMRDKIKADCEKAKAKRREITDFVHVQPCGTCGSTHGCSCFDDACNQATREQEEWGMT